MNVFLGLACIAPTVLVFIIGGGAPVSSGEPSFVVFIIKGNSGIMPRCRLELTEIDCAWAAARPANTVILLVAMLP